MKTENLIEALIKFEAVVTPELMILIFGEQTGRHLTTKLFQIYKGHISSLYSRLDKDNRKILIQHLQDTYIKDDRKDFDWKLVINNTEFFEAVSLPTTQEDNAGGILDKFDLFQNGFYKGRLVQWYKEGYGLFIDGIRIVLPLSAVAKTINHQSLMKVAN